MRTAAGNVSKGLSMFLSETYPGYQVNALGLPAQRRIPEAVERFYREHATCYECGQRIHYPGVTVASRGIHIFHESCAQRHDSKTTRRESVATPPKIIGSIYGAALTFDRDGDRGGCSVIDRDGTPEHEAFMPDCFDQSIAEGGQIACINHDRSRTLRGSFSRIANDGGRLVFRFTLMDGPFERSILERIRSQHIRHCSIGFFPGERQWRAPMTVHARARLTEISLCDGNRPQWFGTYVIAEAA
jgi:hypothetical protein